MEGDIEEHSVGNVCGSQQAKKGNEGDRHGVEGRVEDGQIGLGGHHSPGGKDERAKWLRDIQNNDFVAITVWIVLIWSAWRAPKWSQRSFGVA
jgi:hypothetical protein